MSNKVHYDYIALTISEKSSKIIALTISLKIKSEFRSDDNYLNKIHCYWNTN